MSESLILLTNFSNNFHNLYNLYFPVDTTKFNKKIHRMEKWMTKGILISRSIKIKLGKKCFTHPSIANSNIFKTYGNTYNVVIRCAKKLYYERELNPLVPGDLFLRISLPKLVERCIA